METLVPTTPTQIADYRVEVLALVWTASMAAIKVHVRGSNGELYRCGYSGSVAATLITQLNKANLSTSSLQKRVLERLRDDGQLPAGTVQGSPD